MLDPIPNPSQSSVACLGVYLRLYSTALLRAPLGVAVIPAFTERVMVQGCATSLIYAFTKTCPLFKVYATFVLHSKTIVLCGTAYFPFLQQNLLDDCIDVVCLCKCFCPSCGHYYRSVSESLHYKETRRKFATWWRAQLDLFTEAETQRLLQKRRMRTLYMCMHSPVGASDIVQQSRIELLDLLTKIDKEGRRGIMGFLVSLWAANRHLYGMRNLRIYASMYIFFGAGPRSGFLNLLK